MTTFIYAIGVIFQALTIVIIFSAILSWLVMIYPRNNLVVSLYHVLRQITEPILAPLRRIIPLIGTIDITPIVAIIILQIISQVLAAYL
jgi:YggT family protein